MSPVAPGTRLGSFEITAKLGEGGMGEVWRATDARLRREVAIKVLPAAFVADPERLARFEREAQLLAQLNHPNIAQIYGLEASGETRALVMELVDGPTLAERLEAGPLPVEESLGLALQIAQALEEAHEKGIVHRDLKPQNIKASSEGKIKVLDFGLAKAMDPAGGATGAEVANSPTLTFAATRQGVILGTAAYMAPEQARGAAVDKRVDIWAFGVVLYEMLTGRRLFDERSVVDTLSAVMRKEIDFERLPGSTPRRLRDLLRRCLERNPRNRLHDIADARLELEELVRGEGIGEPGSAIASPPVGASRRLVVAWAGAALFAAVAVALGALLWRQLSLEPVAPRFERLTFAPLFVSNARFTADGRTVVYSAAREGNRSELFVRPPEDAQSRLIGRADMQLLSVSSKGELAVLTRARYESHRTYIGTLATMPLAEASPREILNDVSAADWSPDGAALAVVRQVAGKRRIEYPIGTVLAETAGYFSDVRVSPKGDLVAYMSHAFVDDNRGTVVVADRSGKVVAQTPEYWGEEGVAWSADGTTVYFTASERGSEYSIHALTKDGAVRSVLDSPAALIVHDMAPDGKLLVASHLDRATIVARMPGAAAERELPWLEKSYFPVLSRDGRSLLFEDESELAGPLYSVYLRPADGSPPVRLGEGGARDISPDGASVLALVFDDPPRLMVYPTGAGETRDISAEGFATYDLLTPRFSRDGKSVAFCGSPAGKPSRCYVRELSGGSPRAVTPENTDHGSMSPDGTAMVARGVDGRYQIYAMDGSESVPVPGLGERDEIVRWWADGRSLIVWNPIEIPARVERLDLSSGERTLLRELDPADRTGVVHYWGVSFSEDESSYAYGIARYVGTLYTVEGLR